MPYEPPSRSPGRLNSASCSLIAGEGTVPLVITLEEPGIRSGENAVGETRLVLRGSWSANYSETARNGRSQNARHRHHSLNTTKTAPIIMPNPTR